jgi:hypothetical protein
VPLVFFEIRFGQPEGNRSQVSTVCLRQMMNRTRALLFLAAICFGGLGKQAEAQLRWPEYPPKTTPVRVRLVALAWTLPSSSYGANYEVFVAETEIEHNEWRLIKLVFSFLPFQPRLSESGFDYSVVHEIAASRNADCDETISQLTARSLPTRHEPLLYAQNVPREDLDRRRIPLPCYQTNADDYIKATFEPIAPPAPPPEPSLKQGSR